MRVMVRGLETTDCIVDHVQHIMEKQTLYNLCFRKIPYSFSLTSKTIWLMFVYCAQTFLKRLLLLFYSVEYLNIFRIVVLLQNIHGIYIIYSHNSQINCKIIYFLPFLLLFKAMEMQPLPILDNLAGPNYYLAVIKKSQYALKYQFLLRKHAAIWCYLQTRNPVQIRGQKNMQRSSFQCGFSTANSPHQI